MKRGRLLQTLIVCAMATAVVVALCLLPVAPLWRELQGRVLEHSGQSFVSLAALFATFNILLLPGGFLMLAAGALFGLLRGFLVVLIGNTIGAAIAFGIGRRFGRPWARRVIERNKKIAALAPAIERGGWRVIVLSQLNPLFPTSLLVYFYSLTPISFWSCMGLVALARTPGLLLYVYLGSLGAQTLNLSQHASVRWLMIFSGILTVALVLVLARATKARLFQ